MCICWWLDATIKYILPVSLRPVPPWKQITNQRWLLLWFRSAIIPDYLLTTTMIIIQLIGVETYSQVNFDITLYSLCFILVVNLVLSWVKPYCHWPSISWISYSLTYKIYVFTCMMRDVFIIWSNLHVVRLQISRNLMVKDRSVWLWDKARMTINLKGMEYLIALFEVCYCILLSKLTLLSWCTLQKVRL